MDIFNYHPVTNEYIGAGKADPNPMEEGEWLMPAFSTPDAPPVPPEGHTVVWGGGAWTTLPDHRGEIWWKADAEFNTDPRKVLALGDPKKFGLTDVEPPASPAPEPVISVTVDQIRSALSGLGKTPEQIDALFELAKSI